MTKQSGLCRMAESLDARSIRILLDLDCIFKQEPDIEEYDIIPVLEPTSNKSPLILVDHRLGVELWCVKSLYLYAYLKVMRWRNDINSTTYLETDEIISLTRAILLINPECATVWNVRKQLIEKDDLRIDDDMRFGALVFTKHPKSQETFAHRRWLLKRQKELKQTHLSSREVDGLIPHENAFHSQENLANNDIEELCPYLAKEILICDLTARGYSCNYASWSHRAWVMEHLAFNKPQIIKDELAVTQSWITMHVSDHSGFHYRQYLLTSLIRSCSESSLRAVQDELHVTSSLIADYPEHQAVWYHRRYCFQALLKCAKIEKKFFCSTSGVSDITKALKRPKLDRRHTLIVSEMEWLNKSHCDFLSKCHKSLMSNHESWIKTAIELSGT